MYELTPKDFSNIFPMGSVARSWEAERIAKNIMVILARSGNVFRPLSWDEYKKERLQDGAFTESEKRFFDGVIDYCKSPDTARLFSEEWKFQ